MSEISTITSVSKQYESSGDCSTVSTGSGDLGGISYGSYQLSSNAGSVDSFLDFAQNYPNDALANYGRTLAQYEVNSQEFINTWEERKTVKDGTFDKKRNSHQSRRQNDDKGRCSDQRRDSD